MGGVSQPWSCYAGMENWEEPFGRSLGSYLLPEKTGAEQERQSAMGVRAKERCMSAGLTPALSLFRKYRSRFETPPVRSFSPSMSAKGSTRKVFSKHLFCKQMPRPLSSVTRSAHLSQRFDFSQLVGNKMAFSTLQFGLFS